MVMIKCQQLEKLLRDLKAGKHPTKAQLCAAMQSVEHEECKSIMKVNNCLGNAFHSLASCGCTELFSCILDELSKFCTDQELYDLLKNTTDGGETALHKAVFHGHLAFVKLLLGALGKGFLLKLLRIQDVSGHTPLHYATSRGFPEIAVLLLNSVPEGRSTLWNLRNNNGQTPQELIRDVQVFEECLKQYGYVMTTGTLESTTQDLVADNQELLKTNREKDEAIHQLGGEMHALKLTFERVLQQQALYQAQISSLETMLLKSTEKSAAKTDLDELTRQTHDLRTRSQPPQVLTTLQQVEKELADLKRKQEEHEVLCAAKIQELENQLKTIQEEKTEHELVIKGRLEKVETSTQTMQEAIEELKTTTATKAELEELSREVMTLKNNQSVPPTYLPQLEEIENQLNELQRKEKELEQGCAATGAYFMQNFIDLREEISALRVEFDKIKQLAEDNEGKLMQMRKLCCSHCPHDCCCPDSD